MAAALDAIVDERGSPGKARARRRHADPAADRGAPPHRQPLHAARADRADRPPCAGARPSSGSGRTRRPEADPRSQGLRSGDGLGRLPGRGLPAAGRAAGRRPGRAGPRRGPTIPADEDEELHARRLVAQRCLYGVDRNPLAVDLARLSLWLATLARDHEFTFLDHALKSGDSLVGLTQTQIAAVHWDASKPGLPLFRQLVRDRVAEATKRRAEIQAAPDDTTRVIQEARHRFLEGAAEATSALIGDAVIAAFFAEDKPKAREKKRVAAESWLGGSPVAWDKLAALGCEP